MKPIYLYSVSHTISDGEAEDDVQSYFASEFSDIGAAYDEFVETVEGQEKIEITEVHAMEKLGIVFIKREEEKEQ